MIQERQLTLEGFAKFAQRGLDQYILGVADDIEKDENHPTEFTVHEWISCFKEYLERIEEKTWEEKDWEILDFTAGITGTLDENLS